VEADREKPLKAYVVRRRVHAIDEMLVYAQTAEEAKRKACAGEWVDTERLPDEERYGGFQSVRRYPEEDPDAR
jgi:hypothetical protein